MRMLWLAMVQPRRFWHPRLTFVLFLLSGPGGDLPCQAAAAASDSNSTSEPQWFLIPQDDLAVFEAFEYAIDRIDKMRMECGEGFNLAPLRFLSYEVKEAYLRDYALYTEYLLHIKAKYGLAPAEIRVHLAKQHAVEDLSLFQVTDVDPLPCALYSLMDDAELMLPVTADSVTHAKQASLNLLNAQRKVLCPQRAELQLLRVNSASLQPAEGKVMRLVMEFRESSNTFSDNSFTDVIAVIYALDQHVPGQCTVTPEVYPARPPCDMRFTSEEEMASSPTNSTGSSKSVVRRLGGTTDTNSVTRRLSSPDRSGLSEGQVQDFADKGLDIPDNFDPRLERTLCFPRGISRSQGSCGASWAFAATAVASFRECLWDLKIGSPSSGLSFFSAQELISCRPVEGCSGGDASTAFYYMKHVGIARDACSPYKMRCFIDNSIISVSAGDAQTSTPRQKTYQENSQACPINPKVDTSPCRCLPSVYHLSMPTECAMLPNACEKVRVPHYFQIAGTAEGNTVAEIERHMMQELLDSGPLYVSFLFYEDFFDPVSWTESGIYIHRNGDLIGKHAAAAVGWGTDGESRDYWLLLNSLGSGWQQQGYFKISRGETTLQMMKFGAWGVDMSNPDKDVSSPGIEDVEVTYSADMKDMPGTVSVSTIHAAWLEVACKTDEPARLLIRVEGLKSTIVGESRGQLFEEKHVHRIDLMSIGLLGERAKIEMWAQDHSQNSGSWGPFTFMIPSKEEFSQPQTGGSLTRRRLLANHTRSADGVVLI